MSSSRASQRPASAPPRPGRPRKPEPKVDFTGQQPWANVPCAASGCSRAARLTCASNSQADKKPCKFKINKVILQQPIDRDQAARLLSKGKTDLFHEFISSKTGRPFPAYLVMDDMGKVTFEFPPRDTETKPAPAK